MPRQAEKATSVDFSLIQKHRLTADVFQGTTEPTAGKPRQAESAFVQSESMDNPQPGCLLRQKRNFIFISRLQSGFTIGHHLL